MWKEPMKTRLEHETPHRQVLPRPGIKPRRRPKGLDLNPGPSCCPVV